MLFKACVFTNLLLAREKCTLQKCMYFSKWAPSFLGCVFFFWGKLEKKRAPGAQFRFFGGHFGKVRVVCVCGVVCVCAACRGVSDDVLNDLFLHCVFERYDVKTQYHCSVLLEKTAFGGNANLSPADPCLEHPTAACPRKKSKGERSGEHGG